MFNNKNGKDFGPMLTKKALSTDERLIYFSLNLTSTKALTYYKVLKITHKDKISKIEAFKIKFLKPPLNF